MWTIVGDAGAMDMDEARTRAEKMLASIRRGEEVPADPGDTLFEALRRTSRAGCACPLGPCRRAFSDAAATLGHWSAKTGPLVRQSQTAKAIPHTHGSGRRRSQG